MAKRKQVASGYPEVDEFIDIKPSKFPKKGSKVVPKLSIRQFPHKHAVVAVVVPLNPLTMYLEGLSLLSEATLIIIPDGPASGIRSEAISDARVCIAIATLHATVLVNEDIRKQLTIEEFQDYLEFKIIVKQFKQILSSEDPGSVITIYRRMDQENVLIQSCSASSPGETSSNSLSTIDIQERMELDKKIPIESFPFLIKFSKSKFTKVFRKAEKLSADGVRIRLLTHKHHSGFYLFFHAFSDSSRCYFENCYQSKVKNDDGIVFKSQSEPVDWNSLFIEDFEEKVNLIFPVDFILHFIKAITESMITIRLGPDNPLCLESFLGDGCSKLTYILSSRVEDENLTYPDLVLTLPSKTTKDWVKSV